MSEIAFTPRPTPSSLAAATGAGAGLSVAELALSEEEEGQGRGRGRGRGSGGNDNDKDDDDDNRGRSRSESFHESAEEKVLTQQKLVLTPDTPLLPQHLRICMLLDDSLAPATAPFVAWPGARRTLEEEAEERALEAEETRQLELWAKGGEGRGGPSSGGAGTGRSSSKWSRPRRRSSIETNALVPFTGAPATGPGADNKAVVGARDSWLLPRCETRLSVLVVHVGGSTPLAGPVADDVAWTPTEFCAANGRRTRCTLWECVEGGSLPSPRVMSAFASGCSAVLVSFGASAPDASVALARKVLEAFQNAGGVTLGVVSAKKRVPPELKALAAPFKASTFDHGVVGALESIAGTVAKAKVSLVTSGAGAGAGKEPGSPSSSGGKCSAM